MRIPSTLWCVLLSTSAHAIWPLPRDLQTGTSLLQLSSGFDIHVSRPSSAQSLPDLDAAISRTKHHLHHDKHQRLVEGRGENHRTFLNSAPQLSSLVLSLDTWDGASSIFAETVKPLSDKKEGYTLVLPHDGSPATIKAETSLGLLRGLTSFEQLWNWLDGEEDGIVYTSQAPVVINNDSPSYVRLHLRSVVDGNWLTSRAKPYRGFMLDTSRNL
jgi:hexosaminidase